MDCQIDQKMTVCAIILSIIFLSEKGAYMMPGIECGGKGCDFKVKTAAEPATASQMQGMINAAAHHTEGETARVGDYLLKVAVPGIGDAEKGKVEHHRPQFKYHERTPEKGFEKAEVIE